MEFGDARGTTEDGATTMGLFSRRKKNAQPEPATPATSATGSAPPARSGAASRSGVAGHPVCSLRAGMGKAEVLARIGQPTRSMTSGQVQSMVNVLGAGEEGDEPEEYWLYADGDAEPGFIFEVLIRSGQLATVRVKPLGPDGRDGATAIRINENGVQARSPYREELGAQPADW